MTTLSTSAAAVSLRDSRGRRGDAVFSAVAKGSGLAVLGIIVAIAVFLVWRAVPSLRTAGWSFFSEKTWSPDGTPATFGIAALAFGTVVSSLVAMVIAVPVAVGSALFLTEVVGGPLARWSGYLIDMLAAIPSVVYGLWGVFYVVPKLVPVQRATDHAVGAFIPIFHSPGGLYGRSLFAAAVVLAVMILPIVAAIAREVFRQVPNANREAVLALGGTRWEMIRLAVLPFGRSGVVGAAMLGLGRALGETIAVALVLGASYDISVHLVRPGGSTIAANIALKFGESGAQGRSALIAAGLVLFAITLVVNVVARAVVRRSTRATLGRP